MVVPTHQKNATENTILFCICVLNTFQLHKRGFIVNFFHFRNTKYPNYHAPCQLRWNNQRLRSGFNFLLPTVWDAPSSVYEISMVESAVLSWARNTREFLVTDLISQILGRGCITIIFSLALVRVSGVTT